MKKVGILTFHRAHNYGAQLQALALRKTIASLGFEVEFIDYRQPLIEKAYQLFDKDVYKHTSLKNKVSIFLSRCLTLKRRYKRYISFQRFIKENIRTSETYSETNPRPTPYYAIVFGSDQIWTTRFLKYFDPILWGDIKIPAERKISYAPSMEINSLNEKEIDFCGKHLSNFDYISVREDSMKTLLGPLTDKDVEVVLDPVFLCDRRLYLDLSRKAKINLPDKYILLYTVGLPRKEILDICEHLSVILKLPVMRICGYVSKFKKSHQVDEAGPYEFLQLIANASFVISSSFHGTAFSVLFQKDFFSIKTTGVSGRAESLLANLNASDRLISSVDEISPENLQIVNYKEINGRLNALKEQSFKFLKQSLE